MALKRRDGELMTADELGGSETIPKICIVGGPRAGGNLAVRYFTPQTGHASMAVSGGCCLAAATLIPGSVAHDIARNVAKPGAGFTDVEVGIENPAGILETTIVARIEGGMPIIASAAYRRSAQLLVRGKVPLYQASEDLLHALSGLMDSSPLANGRFKFSTPARRAAFAEDMVSSHQKQDLFAHTLWDTALAKAPKEAAALRRVALSSDGSWHGSQDRVKA